MSLMLQSTTAPILSGQPTPNASAARDEQAQNESGSFSEVLSRSLEPATEKPTDKATAATPARRPASPEKADPDALINAMALSLAPLEHRLVKLSPSAGSAGASSDRASADSALPGVAGVAPTALTTLPADGGAAPEAALADIAMSPDTGTQAALVSTLAAASPKTLTQASGQAPLTPLDESPGIALTLEKVAGQSAAPDAGLSAQLSPGDDKEAHQLGQRVDERAEQVPAKPASSSTAPMVELAALPASGKQPTAEAGFNLNAALATPQLTVVQQAAGSTLAAPPPSPLNTVAISPEVGSSEWGKALGQQVINMGHAGSQAAELQLNPPGLGPLKVTLSMNEHQMQAMFVSSHASVRAAVEAALPQLRNALAESGISLGHTSVGAESQQQQQQTAFSNGQSGQPGARPYRGDHLADTAAALPARQLAEAARPSHRLGVDTYA
ncbi:flagellar hook-length control protein FliK [Polaromonas sp. OV174]|uniref:flagellar hook-length control protein FliK n=1 Tax=Polaromonas sp. OV174 TaxID=1855300 RepID=UPI0008E8B3D8|nr:flagellar hook-length control protein FliK [Polaromonas sp. OV174]SFC75629.1 flagellar hook-length control protein FliK [Polaromonas sp. OV174]